MNPKQVAERINLPIKFWPGQCFGVASAMVEKGVVEGKAVYGHYFGFISDDCEQFVGRAFTHHGWIAQGDTIIDPTRWVFEAVEPYIYEGSRNDRGYDEGSNRLREMMMKPPPDFDEEQKAYTLPEGEIRAFAKTMLGSDRDVACAVQVMWLSNLPLNALGDMALPVFEWVADEVGFPGFIPIDNRMSILGR